MLDVKKLLAKILQALTISQTVTFTAYNKPWIFRKVGCVVFFDSPNDGRGFPSGNCTIGTLPVGMRPTYTQRINIGNNSNAFRFVNIEPSGAVTMYNNTAYSSAVNCAVSSAFIAGGGYLTSKLYEIFSHLERWWEYVRLRGIVGENIKRSIQSCCEVRLLSTCKLQRDDTPRWFNAIYQITRWSLCGFLYSRCKNDANANGVGCNKDSGEQSYIGIYKPILLYVKRWWHIQILLRKQSRVLAQCYRYLERKYRLSSWWCGTNVRYRGYNITQISNERGCIAC